MPGRPNSLVGLAACLPDVVRTALGEPNAILGTWDAEPLRGGSGASDARSSLWKLQGTARVGANTRTWQVVLKVLAPAAPSSPIGVEDWKRESLVYGSGLLDGLSVGLRAPRCYRREEMVDGTIRLWLEYIREEGDRHWPIARWALAARHLGQLSRACLDGSTRLTAPWLRGQQLRAWLDRHRPLVARIAAAPDVEAVRQWWPRPVVDAILRLWDERDPFCDALERLPQTFGHGDAIRRNLIARRAADGSEETIAIDWEHAGLYAVGEEVGQTLSVAAAFFDVEPTDLPALDEALFEGYLAGLRDLGWQGDPRSVRFAYAAHAALRNLFNAVGTSVPDESRQAAAFQTYGHTFDELAERRAAIRPFLLARADEARGLLKQIGG